MKYYLLGLLCLPYLVFSQILTLSGGSSITIENTASINLDGLTLAPNSTYDILDNIISLSASPVEVNTNSSIDRVYNTSNTLEGYSGTLVFAYEEDELNGIDESDLVIEIEAADGTWTSYQPMILDQDNNTLSYTFDSVLAFSRITASSVNATLTVEEIATNNPIKVYPNPTTNKLIIVSKDIQNSVLYNVNGQIVFESDRSELNVSQLPKGIYLLHTINTQNQLSTFKIIKK